MGSLISTVLIYILEVVGVTAIQLFTLLGPGLILALLMNYIGGSVKQRAFLTFGRTVYLALFGWLGTSIHELGHALFCLIFGHKITRIRLFDPDPNSHTLGSVSHRYNPNSLYQQIGNLFIGIGPILLGSVVIFLASLLLLPADVIAILNKVTIDPTAFSTVDGILALIGAILNATIELLAALFHPQNLTNWRFYLFLYIAFAVGSSITLSLPDIQGALSGLIVLVLALD